MSGSYLEMSRAMLSRLPFYYRTAKAYAREGKDTISSAQLAENLGVDSAQVRRDVSSLGDFGRAGVGYSVPALAAALEEILGLRNTHEAVIVGMGRFGEALMSLPAFSVCSINVVGAFDTNPEQVGNTVNGVRIRPASELGRIVKRLRVQLAVIAPQVEEPQNTADILVKAGVKAIWNFTNCSLKVPPDVLVRHEDLTAGLCHLSRHLAAPEVER